MLRRELLAVIFCVCFLSLFFVKPLKAQEQEIPERKIPEKENQVLLWKVPQKGAAALLPNISLIGSLAGAYFRDDPVGDQGENPSRTGFNFQGAELAIQSIIDPYVRGDVFLLFLEDAVELEEGFVTTLALPWNLQIRAGKLLARFGRQNTQHLEQIDFADYSRANRYFLGAEGFGELGVELSALFPTPWFSEITFEFLQGVNEANFASDRKQDFVYLGHWKNAVDVTSDLTLQAGLSGAFGYNGTDRGNHTQIYGTDLYLRWRPSARQGLKWQTEYFLRRKEDVGQTLWEGGIYSQVIYQFARRWEAGIRADLIRFPEETLSQWDFSPVLSFLASEFFRVRAQYNYVNTQGTSEAQHEAFLQVQFSMGPHGAHIF
ncbi:MAG: hypothetical protein A3I75_04055 [Deltaproteobacteria bacterium RIFCSPLOWO2_02_FULL_50_16]|nr:MAG: hypothetical protein A3I75_04055 [Deltaproteobacteria bacterium RIFCSPLOWO2_02_FULL_50_16]OGQ65363.1 MAG: hypothetical protein A3F89_07085 [Deltaproteobacteria bacterium RIFCSPLOWO2_12_FULL_50_11]